MTDPSKREFFFWWHEFYKYESGGRAVTKERDVHPIAVDAKDSSPKSIQFRLTSEEFAWEDGKYTVAIQGWVNRKNVSKKPNVSGEFHFSITDGDLEGLNGELDHSGQAGFKRPPWSNGEVRTPLTRSHKNSHTHYL